MPQILLAPQNCQLCIENLHAFDPRSGHAVPLQQAMVKVTLTDLMDRALAGYLWPQLLEKVPKSANDYEGTFPELGVLVPDQLVIIKMSAEEGKDLKGYWEIDIEVGKRREF